MKCYCGIDGVKHTLAKVLLPYSSLAIRTQDLSWRCIFSRRVGSERSSTVNAVTLGQEGAVGSPSDSDSRTVSDGERDEKLTERSPSGRGWYFQG
jgi:hypothetical protein